MLSIISCRKLAKPLESVSTTPQLDIEIFLSHLLNLSRAQLKAYPEKELSFEQARELKQMIERRLKREPVAYIVGHQPFWTLDLVVTRDTLIPRPETEHLVEWILQAMPKSQPLQVADLGVGSGAIALSLAKEAPRWQIDGTDFSPAVLQVALQNKEKHMISNVSFYQGTWCSALPHHGYNIIVSNPPYIANSDPHLPQLLFEPKTALVAQENGLGDIKTIVAQGKNYLVKNGLLVIEHGYNQAKQVKELLIQQGYQDVLLHKDFSNNDRFVSAWWQEVPRSAPGKARPFTDHFS